MIVSGQVGSPLQQLPCVRNEYLNQYINYGSDTQTIASEGSDGPH